MHISIGLVTWLIFLGPCIIHRKKGKEKKKKKREKKGRDVLSCFDCEFYIINEGFFFLSPFFVLAEHFLPA